MKDKIMTEIESNIEMIKQAREEIADLKEEKIQKRSDAWDESEGTAKQKEDFVRAVVSDIDRQIAYKEANIEYLYSRNSLLNDKLVFIDNE